MKRETQTQVRFTTHFIYSDLSLRAYMYCTGEFLGSLTFPRTDTFSVFVQVSFWTDLVWESRAKRDKLFSTLFWLELRPFTDSFALNSSLPHNSRVIHSHRRVQEVLCSVGMASLFVDGQKNAEQNDSHKEVPSSSTRQSQRVLA